MILSRWVFLASLCRRILVILRSGRIVCSFHSRMRSFSRSNLRPGRYYKAHKSYNEPTWCFSSTLCRTYSEIWTQKSQARSISEKIERVSKAHLHWGLNLGHFFSDFIKHIRGHFLAEFLICWYFDPKMQFMPGAISDELEALAWV